LARDFPKERALFPAGLHLPHDHEPDRDQEDQGPYMTSAETKEESFVGVISISTPLARKVLHQVGVVRRVGLEPGLPLAADGEYWPLISSPRIVTFWT
jgi:hypothetical protein